VRAKATHDQPLVAANGQDIGLLAPLQHEPQSLVAAVNRIAKHPRAWHARIERRLPRAILNLGEIEAVLSTAELSDPVGLRDRAIMEVAYSTGMRRSEICALHLHDLDAERQTVTVRQGKGRRDRIIPIGERALVWIDRYLADSRPALAKGASLPWLFVARDATDLTPDHLTIRVGRYISLPDIEAQLAPNNYTYSHSLLYSYDAYTQTGINTTTMFNLNWMLQVGISAGNDVAPWQPHDAKPTLNTCLRWTSTSGNDNLYPCLNSLNDGKYAYNNVQSIYNTWYHKFNATWHTDTEWWYMWEKDVPNVLNPAAAHLLETNANGAMCDSPKQLTCFAPEWAVVNYLEKELSRRDYISIRNEYFDDIKGQRTGFKTRYTEHLLGWGHWIGTTITIRPELRFERSYDMPAYDLGRKSNQFIFASDIIIKY